MSVTRFGLVFLQDKESRYEKLVCSVNPLLNERVSLRLVASSKESIATKKKKSRQIYICFQNSTPNLYSGSRKHRVGTVIKIKNSHYWNKSKIS